MFPDEEGPGEHLRWVRPTESGLESLERPGSKAREGRSGQERSITEQNEETLEERTKQGRRQ